MDEHGSLDLAMGRDTQCVETIIDQLVDLTSPAQKPVSQQRRARSTPSASATPGERIRLNERSKNQDGHAPDNGPFNQRRDFHCLDPFFE